MHILKAMMLVFTLMLCLALVGCGGPSDDIVRGAVKKDLDSKRGFNIGEIIDLEITNDYTQEQGNETVYVYDYRALVKHHPDMLVFITNKEEGTYEGSIALVHRGDSWYRLR